MVLVEKGEQGGGRKGQVYGDERKRRRVEENATIPSGEP